ncbi:DUF6343 family protein [Streptomyces sp. 7R007]
MSDDHPKRIGQSGPRAAPGAAGARTLRTGTEPATARSALRLRLLLAWTFLPLFIGAAVASAVGAANAGSDDSPGRDVWAVIAGVCGVLALTALLDLTILSRRLRRQRDGWR